jgi:hypothetical protein
MTVTAPGKTEEWTLPFGGEGFKGSNVQVFFFLKFESDYGRRPFRNLTTVL